VLVLPVTGRDEKMLDIRFWPLADIANVCFQCENGHRMWGSEGAGVELNVRAD
jgi:hypothetical protein